MNMRPTQCVSRTLQAQLEGAHAVLFSGDLTSKGNMPAYSECLAHFGKALGLTRWAPENVHAVPGNHPGIAIPARSGTLEL